MRTSMENMIGLTLARGYIKKLLDNVNVVLFLNANYAALCTEFEAIAQANGILKPKG